MTGIVPAVLGALLLGALSTLGDFVWANWQVRHLAVYGVIHGMAIFLAIGLFLGALAGRPTAGAASGVIAGAAAAGSFYVMAPLLGYGAMFVSWILVWVALGLINLMLRARRPEKGSVSVAAGSLLAAGVGRGVAAAMLSGVAFYAVSGMWSPFNPEGWDYAEHFARWTVAYLPGFAALLVGRSGTKQTGS
jgi:hypothetical protein